MPLGGVDAVVLDDTAKQCVTALDAQHPGFVRWVQDMTIPEYQPYLTWLYPGFVQRVPERAVSSKGRAGGAMGACAGHSAHAKQPGGGYQYMIWVVMEQRLRAGENAFHFDSDALVVGNLWPHLLSLDLIMDADLVGTCDCAGPGCKEFGCSFNPGVMLMRVSQGSLALLTGVFARWDSEDWLDPSTHQMKQKWVTKPIRSTHELADMNVVNTWLVQHGNCSKVPSKGKEAAFQCNNVTLATFTKGHERGGRECRGEKPWRSATCKPRGLVISHSHDARNQVFFADPPEFPASPPGAKPAPVHAGSRPPTAERGSTTAAAAAPPKRGPPQAAPPPTSTGVDPALAPAPAPPAAAATPEGGPSQAAPPPASTGVEPALAPAPPAAASAPEGGPSQAVPPPGGARDVPAPAAPAALVAPALPPPALPPPAGELAAPSAAVPALAAGPGGQWVRDPGSFAQGLAAGAALAACLGGLVARPCGREGAAGAVASAADAEASAKPAVRPSRVGRGPADQDEARASVGAAKLEPWQLPRPPQRTARRRARSTARALVRRPAGDMGELQKAIEYLEAFPAPSGLGVAHVDEQLVPLRAQRDAAAAALAADREAGLSRAAKLRREAYSVSRAEKKAAGARRALVDAAKAVADAEAELQEAQEKRVRAEEQQSAAQERFNSLEAAAAQARDGQERAVSERDLEATRGLFVQLRTLPTAHTAGNFARAWESMMEQLAAVEALFSAPECKTQLQQRERWGDSCPLDGGAVGSDSDIDLLEPLPAEERGQAARRGPAAGGWTKVAPGLVSSLAAEAADLGPLATVTPVAVEAQGRRAAAREAVHGRLVAALARVATLEAELGARRKGHEAAAVQALRLATPHAWGVPAFDLAAAGVGIEQIVPQSELLGGSPGGLPGLSAGADAADSSTHGWTGLDVAQQALSAPIVGGLGAGGSYKSLGTEIEGNASSILSSGLPVPDCVGDAMSVLKGEEVGRQERLVALKHAVALPMARARRSATVAIAARVKAAVMKLQALTERVATLGDWFTGTNVVVDVTGSIVRWAEAIHLSQGVGAVARLEQAGG
ncbi:unnamed protein product, partial [Prorocentrum cordatum]